MKNDTLTSFVNVENFIRAYSPDESYADSKYGFTTIDLFINQNIDLLLHSTEFNKTGIDESTKNPPKLTNLSLRGADYKVNEQNCQSAFHISKLFNLNHKELLRVLSQMTSSWDYNNSASIVTLTECALKERNSTINVVSLLINDNSLPILNDKYYNKFTSNDTKFQVCQDLIKSVESILINFNMNANVKINLNDYLLSQQEFDELLNMKNSYDLIYLTNILKLLSNLILNSIVPNDIILQWFKVAIKLTSFLQNNLTSIISNIPMNIIEKIESLVTVDSLLLLGLDTTISAVNVESSYFNDPTTFFEVQQIIDEMSTNSVLSYMWSFVLFTKSYLIEEEPIKYASFLNELINLNGSDMPLDELSVLFAQRAESLNVLDSIITISNSLSPDSLYPTIMSTFITFQLNFVPINIDVSNVIKCVLPKTPKEFVEKFLTSDIFERKLSVIKAKLPLIDEALIPLINICSTNIEFANFQLNELNTYTTRTKLGEIDYDLVDDDTNLALVSSSLTSLNNNTTDLIVLKKELLVHPPLEFNESILMPIPENTKAKILQVGSTVDESLVVFLHNYNGWSIIGHILQNLCNLFVKENDEIENRYQVMIMTIIELVSNVVSSDITIETSTEILQNLSHNIDEEDIIPVIFKIFETSLRKRNYSIACICCEFTNSLVANYPHSVWSFLARSDLLDRYGKNGLASIILGTMELSNGTYTLTLSLSKLANLLVNESLLLGTNMPSKTKEDILNKLITHLLNIYESYRFWKFENIYERFELGSQLTTLFTNVLYNIYGIDPQTRPDHKITSVLAKSGRLLINGFLGHQSSESNSATSLIKILTSYTDKQVYALGNLVFGPVYSNLIVASYNLTTLLVSLRDLLKMTPSALEHLIFTNSSALVNIYCLSRSLKRPIINLLNAIISITWNDDIPFLLSYIGEKYSKIFVHVVESDLENPLDDFRLANDIYAFLSALLESKQDGLSILFLTGDVATIENIDKFNATKKIENKSILTILKKNALKLEQLPDYVSCSLLDAISYAFNTWVYNKNLNDSVDFIETIMNIFKAFKPSNIPVDQLSYDEILILSNKFRLISRIIEIFALYTYTTNDNSSSIHALLNSDELFSIIKPYFEIQGNDIKLLEDIEVKFNKEFPKFVLSSFRFSPLTKPHSSNDSNIFNMSLIDTLFIGTCTSLEKSDSLNVRGEIRNASLKLQYVNHQIAAAKSWGAVITSFIKSSNTPLKDTYIDIVSHFLQTNIDNTIEGELLSQVFQERIELCFYILYSFQMNKKSIPEKKLMNILSQLIVIFKSDTINYLKYVASSTNRSVYRPVLRSVLIILDLVKNSQEFVELASDKILEFFEWAFSNGVYLILSNMLADISSSNNNMNTIMVHNIDDKIQDLFLLLSLFNKTKQLKPTKSFNLILASSLNEVGTLKVILNLYSSFPSIRLNKDPVLGNLILTLVSELCTVKEISEKFITNGLFAVLLESSLSVTLQQGDIKPETKPIFHNIWSNGLLSIMLLLLSEFGIKVLPECCLFASYFSKQIQTAIFSWSNSTLAVSTALIKETTQLVLLQKMLESLNYQQYLVSSNVSQLDGSDDKTLHLVIGLDSPEERKDLSSTLNKLLTHPKYLNSRIIASTQEEQQTIEDEANRVEFVSQINREIKELNKSLFQTL